jgi:DNA primase
MKKEYDFSKGERGKFFRPDAELNIPVYLDPDVAKAFRSSVAVNKALRTLLRSSAATRRLTRPSGGRGARLPR